VKPQKAPRLIDLWPRTVDRYSSAGKCF